MTMIALAIIVPVGGAAYFIFRIQKEGAKEWQAYACLTSLLFLISAICLAQSGEVQSFDVAGNSVRLVDQKLAEVENLTDQNKLMAIQTVKLVNQAFTGVFTVESYDDKAVQKDEANLLKSAGLSQAEIEEVLSQSKGAEGKNKSP
jgi:hypothetical protein